MENGVLVGTRENSIEPGIPCDSFEGLARMKEKHLEDVICRYPEIIEEDLQFVDRQVHVRGKIVDVLFQDRHGQQLILELKKGAIKRQDLAQILDYEGFFLSSDNAAVRIMLVGNRVPLNLQKAFDHHGIEWKELPVSGLIDFLEKKKDTELLQYFTNEESLFRSEQKEKATPKQFVPKKGSPGRNAGVWSEETFLEALVTYTTDEYVQCARNIFSWAKQHEMTLQGGSGAKVATIHPAAGGKRLFRIESTGKVLVSFRNEMPPLPSEEAMDTLFQKLTSLSFVHWDQKVRRTWGRIDLSELKGDGFKEFMDVFMWVIGEMKV